MTGEKPKKSMVLKLKNGLERGKLSRIERVASSTDWSLDVQFQTEHEISKRLWNQRVAISRSTHGGVHRAIWIDDPTITSIRLAITWVVIIRIGDVVDR